MCLYPLKMVQWMVFRCIIIPSCYTVNLCLLLLELCSFLLSLSFCLSPSNKIQFPCSDVWWWWQVRCIWWGKYRLRWILLWRILIFYLSVLCCTSFLYIPYLFSSLSPFVDFSHGRSRRETKKTLSENFVPFHVIYHGWYSYPCDYW